MRELNVPSRHSDKYCQKQQRPGFLEWRKEAVVESEPDLKLAHTTAEKSHFPTKKTRAPGKSKLFNATAEYYSEIGRSPKISDQTQL